MADRTSEFAKVAHQDAEAVFWSELAEKHDITQALSEALWMVSDAYENAEYEPSSTTSADSEAES